MIIVLLSTPKLFVKLYSSHFMLSFTSSQCCHQCKSQSANIDYYLTNVAGVFKSNVTDLLNQYGVQVRFEFAHQSGALLEVPAINIGAVGTCTTRNAASE